MLNEMVDLMDGFFQLMVFEAAGHKNALVDILLISLNTLGTHYVTDDLKDGMDIDSLSMSMPSLRRKALPRWRWGEHACT